MPGLLFKANSVRPGHAKPDAGPQCLSRSQNGVQKGTLGIKGLAQVILTCHLQLRSHEQRSQSNPVRATTTSDLCMTEPAHEIMALIT